jgi:hypothetical protein
MSDAIQKAMMIVASRNGKKRKMADGGQAWPQWSMLDEGGLPPWEELPDSNLLLGLSVPAQRTLESWPQEQQPTTYSSDPADWPSMQDRLKYMTDMGGERAIPRIAEPLPGVYPIGVYEPREVSQEFASGGIPGWETTVKQAPVEYSSDPGDWPGFQDRINTMGELYSALPQETYDRFGAPEFPGNDDNVISSDLATYNSFADLQRYIGEREPSVSQEFAFGGVPGTEVADGLFQPANLDTTMPFDGFQGLPEAQPAPKKKVRIPVDARYITDDSGQVMLDPRYNYRYMEVDEDQPSPAYPARDQETPAPSFTDAPVAWGVSQLPEAVQPAASFAALPFAVPEMLFGASRQKQEELAQQYGTTREENPGAALAGHVATLPWALVEGIGHATKTGLDTQSALAQNIPVHPETVSRANFDLTSLAPIGVGAAKATGVVDTGDLGVFAGRKAKTADQAKLKLAEALDEVGTPREDIWDQTGWFKGVDGNWRFEIDDSNAVWNSVAERENAQRERVAGQIYNKYGFRSLVDVVDEYPNDPLVQQYRGLIERSIQRDKDLEGIPQNVLSDYYQHPDLYAAYPHMRRTPTGEVDFAAYGHNLRGGVSEDGALYLSNNTGVLPRDQRVSTAAHEAQHVVQRSEGHAEGTMPSFSRQRPEFESVKQEAFDALSRGHLPEFMTIAPEEIDILRSLDPEQAADVIASRFMYLRSAGEVEARNVQARLNMTPQERAANPPWTTQDMPDNLQLFSNSDDAALPGVAIASERGRTAEGSAGARPEAGGLPDTGGLRGGEAELAAPGRAANPYAPIPGIPRSVKIPGYGDVETRPIPWAVDAANSYLGRFGQEHLLPEEFAKFDPEMAAKYAQAFEDMQHDPSNPAVRRAFEALADETIAQYKALKDAGAEFRFNENGVDPYAASPAMGYPEFRDQRTLSIFPTLEGYGSAESGLIDNNPLLKSTGEKFGEHPTTVNDLFRAVHDAFGHYTFGNPFFRHAGEDRAYILHSGMYGDDAVKAAATELRGQNSWLNFGPHGEHNRTASAADTIYAPQKTALMPEWAQNYGTGRQKRGLFANDEDASIPGIAVSTADDMGFDLPYRDEVSSPAVHTDPELFDYATHDEMPAGNPLGLEDLPYYEGKRGMPERMEAIVDNPKVTRRLNKAVEKGLENSGTVLNWYNTEPLRERFGDLYEGDMTPDEAYLQYMQAVGTTSPQNPVNKNIANATQIYQRLQQGKKIPRDNKLIPGFETPGGLTRTIVSRKKFGQEEGFDPFEAPKTEYFGRSLAGDTGRVVVDSHASRLLGMSSEDPRMLTTSARYFDPGSETYGSYNPREMLETGDATMKDALSEPTWWRARPTKAEYKYAAQPFEKAAKKYGIDPGQAQAAAWYGAAEQTGVKTPPKTFNELFEERIRQNADALGMSPEDVLSDVINGRRTLFSNSDQLTLPGLAIAAERSAKPELPSMAVPGRVLHKGLYSVLDENINATPMKAGNAQQWRNAAKKGQQAAKDEEIFWRGFDDFLKTKGPNEKFTKEEVQAYLAENPVTIREMIHNEEGSTAGDVRRNELENLGDRDLDLDTDYYKIELNKDRVQKIEDAMVVRPMEDGTGWEVVDEDGSLWDDGYQNEAQALKSRHQAARDFVHESGEGYAIYDPDGTLISDDFKNEKAAKQDLQQLAYDREYNYISEMSDKEIFDYTGHDKAEETSGYLERPEGGSNYREEVAVLDPKTLERKGSKGWPSVDNDVHPDSIYDHGLGWLLAEDYNDIGGAGSGTAVHEAQSRWGQAGAGKGWKSGAGEDIAKLQQDLADAEKAYHATHPRDRYFETGDFTYDGPRRVWQPKEMGLRRVDNVADAVRDVAYAQHDVDRTKENIAKWEAEGDADRVAHWQGLLAEYEKHLATTKKTWEDFYAPHLTEINPQGVSPEEFPAREAYDKWKEDVANAQLRYNEARNRLSTAEKGVQPGPFVQDSSGMPLLMKRGLYEAAQRGDDWFALANPDVIAERWGGNGAEELYRTTLPNTLEKLARMHDKKAKLEEFYPGEEQTPVGNWNAFENQTYEPVNAWPIRRNTFGQDDLPFEGQGGTGLPGRFGHQNPTDSVQSTQEIKGVYLDYDKDGNAIYRLTTSDRPYFTKDWSTGKPKQEWNGPGQSFKSRAAAEKAMKKINDSLAEAKSPKSRQEMIDAWHEASDNNQTYRGIRLTPEMRKSIVERGFPMFVNPEALSIPGLAIAAERYVRERERE